MAGSPQTPHWIANVPDPWPRNSTAPSVSSISARQRLASRARPTPSARTAMGGSSPGVKGASLIIRSM